MPAEPRTGRGRASRERIVERAAELFAEQGVAATSLDDVLAAAGAGKSQLYHYFRGRDELVEAAVGLRCAQVLARGRLARRAGHGAAGQHRRRDGAEPDAQGPGVVAYRGASGARARAKLPGLGLY